MLDTRSRYNAYDNFERSKEESCTEPFLLCNLKRNEPDKLGNTVEDIYWIAANYAIYRSERGVYVRFSDCTEEEHTQCQHTAETGTV